MILYLLSQVLNIWEPVAAIPCPLVDLEPGERVFYGADSSGRRVIAFDSSGSVVWEFPCWKDFRGPFSLTWNGEHILVALEGHVALLNQKGSCEQIFETKGVLVQPVARSIAQYGPYILVLGYDPSDGTVFQPFSGHRGKEGSFGLPGDRAISEIYPGACAPVGLSVSPDTLLLFAVNPFHPKGMLYGNGRYLNSAKIPMELEKATVTTDGKLVLRQVYSSAFKEDTVFLCVYVPLAGILKVFLYSVPKCELLATLEAPQGYQMANRLLRVEGDWLLLWGEKGIWRAKWR
ncbi:MAG: hypothetical protein ABIM88_01335 [candidate division WOR-3 bacterium]